MKKILILSGKGGTGKTTLASAIIKLAHIKAFADCDVDAPNLHLVTKFENEPIENDFLGMQKATINSDLCISCGKCQENCRFDAIYKTKNNKYYVEDTACEGCAVCTITCPVAAVSMVDDVAGNLFLYKSQKETFSTAKLKMGRGNSGLLVTCVKKNLDDNLPFENSSSPYSQEVEIIDGSPGIGCPVIASINGVDLVLIVTEPSISGISDLERIVETAQRFNIETKVCINKFDANLENTKKIELFCQNSNLELIGKIPFDKEVSKAINVGKTIADTDSAAKNAVLEIIKNIDLLKERI